MCWSGCFIQLFYTISPNNCHSCQSVRFIMLSYIVSSILTCVKSANLAIILFKYSCRSILASTHSLEVPIRLSILYRHHLVVYDHAHKNLRSIKVIFLKNVIPIPPPPLAIIYDSSLKICVCVPLCVINL